MHFNSLVVEEEEVWLFGLLQCLEFTWLPLFRGHSIQGAILEADGSTSSKTGSSSPREASGCLVSFPRTLQHPSLTLRLESQVAHLLYAYQYLYLKHKPSWYPKGMHIQENTPLKLTSNLMEKLYPVWRKLSCNLKLKCIV